MNERPVLSCEAQGRALDWLPEDGSERPDGDVPIFPLWQLDFDLGLASHRPVFATEHPDDVEPIYSLWRATPLGLALKAERQAAIIRQGVG